jgi:hypothetical protein
MLSGPQKTETSQADLQPNITPPYPAWVKEFINRRIDASQKREHRYAGRPGSFGQTWATLIVFGPNVPCLGSRP